MDNLQISTDGGENWKEIVCAPDTALNTETTVVLTGKDEHGNAILEDKINGVVFLGPYQDWMEVGKTYIYKTDKPK